MENEAVTDVHFLSIIVAHQQAGLQQLGKIANPMTGKTERNLEGARYAIEVLESLEKKTRGNLSAEEEQILQEALSMLRLNYVDESRKGDGDTGDETEVSKSEESAATGESEN